MLSKASILAVKDFTYKDIEIPEWGGSVRVRGLSAAERDKFEMEAGVNNDLVNMRARFITTCIIDENGESLFSQKEATKIGEKNASVVNRIFDVVRDLSGMGDADLEAADVKSESQ